MPILPDCIPLEEEASYQNLEDQRLYPGYHPHLPVLLSNWKVCVAMDKVVVQIEVVDLKEKEVKRVSIAQIEGVNYRVEEPLLVKEVVVASLFLDSKQHEKKKLTPPSTGRSSTLKY